VVLADTENVQTDLVRLLDAFKKFAHPVDGLTERPASSKRAAKLSIPISIWDCPLARGRRRIRLDRFHLDLDLRLIANQEAACLEHEYERAGVVQYLAAWDVHRAVVFGRCELKTGKAAFGRLVDDVMNQEPYRSAVACSGSWTTAPHIVASVPLKSCTTDTHAW
jgi:hypothetical protein